MSTTQKQAIIGERFKRLREDVIIDGKVLSQKDLAKELSISNTRISAIENGRDEATLTELLAYNKRFNVPIEYLLGISRSSKYKNIDCSKRLGLSDKAIATLEEWNEKYEHENFTFLLNYLFEAGLMWHFLMLLHRFLYGDVENFTLRDKINEIDYHRSSIEIIENKEDEGRYIANIEGGSYERKITTEDLNELHEISLMHIIRDMKTKIQKNPKQYNDLLKNFTFHGHF